VCASKGIEGRNFNTKENALKYKRNIISNQLREVREARKIRGTKRGSQVMNEQRTWFHGTTPTPSFLGEGQKKLAQLKHNTLWEFTGGEMHGIPKKKNKGTAFMVGG